MNEAKAEFGMNEEKIFFKEVHDEVLEAAAGSKAEKTKAFTLSMCTANQECPF